MNDPIAWRRPVSGSRPRIWPITLATLITALFTAQGPVAAQDPAPAAPADAPTKFDTLPIAPRMIGTTIEDKTLHRDTTMTVNRILSGEEPLTGKETLFDAYHSQFVFAKMTQTDADSLASLAGDRQKFLEKLARARSDAAHDRLVDLTFNTMSTIATGNFHPAVRYNAMLIIGELNSKEVVLIGEGAAPPIPLLTALKVMLDELKSPTQIDAVRAAAIVGILRHAEYDGQRPEAQRMPANARKAVRDDMLALLAATDPPPGRSPEGHEWMQRRAVEVLGALGEVGEGGEVLTALLTILDDASAPVSYRCDAAIALGRLQYPQGFAVDPAVMAQKMGDLATQIAREEASVLEDLLREVDTESLQGTSRRGSSYQPSGRIIGPAPNVGQPSGTTVLRDGPITSGTSKSSKSSGRSSKSGSSRGSGRGGRGSGGSGSGSLGGSGGSTPSSSGPSRSPPGPGSGSSGGYGGSGGSLGGSGSYRGPSGQFGPVQGDPEVARTLDIVRRRLAYRMYSLKLGLNGPGRDPGAFVALADADKKPFVEDVHQGVVELLNVAADAQLALDKLNDELLASVRKLEAIVKVSKPAVEGDVPEDVPGGDIPKSDMPGADVPGADVPGSDVPGADGKAVDLDLP